ncbi:MAG: hemerythrin domain-containing protein [Candidatus Krumholzibacteria bacterium]|nr:hemerythrin domain-containing protein [Candidatus Krumholzibacteria bacterium]
MKPRGPLMIEHRLIERMLDIVAARTVEIGKTGTVDPVFIDTTVDFIKTYADRTHHGKEEDILFMELEKKDLSPRDKRGLDELVDEHVRARAHVKELIEAKERFVAGENGALDRIVAALSWLVGFYPKHIEKEDKVFFPDTERYFDDGELDAMLADFHEFDRKMIHEKYRALVDSLAPAR